jgi:DNA-binding NarL/FixJ family response regulator
MKEISVCIVDDNRDLRNALEEIISHVLRGFKCVGTIGTPQEAITQIPILNPDVVLMDTKPWQRRNRD